MNISRDESIHIESVSLHDSEKIEEAIQLLNQFSAEHDGPIPWSAQTSLPKLFVRHRAIIHLARIEGQPVGVSLCQLNLISFQGSEALNLHDLYVIPSARGQGVGRQLLQKLMCEARALGSFAMKSAIHSLRSRYDALAFGAPPLRKIFQMPPLLC